MLKNSVFWIILVVVEIIALTILGAIADVRTDRKAYNNGQCPLCEGEYRFASGSYYHHSHYYYYTCDECGHTIETHSLMK